MNQSPDVRDGFFERRLEFVKIHANLLSASGVQSVAVNP
jgi:hypothetical protein